MKRTLFKIIKTSLSSESTSSGSSSVKHFLVAAKLPKLLENFFLLNSHKKKNPVNRSIIMPGIVMLSSSVSVYDFNWLASSNFFSKL
jgi:hypothetical protein